MRNDCVMKYNMKTLPSENSPKRKKKCFKSRLSGVLSEILFHAPLKYTDQVFNKNKQSVTDSVTAKRLIRSVD